MQGVRQKELDHNLTSAQLASQGAQACLIFARRNAERDLFTQVRRKLGLKATGSGVINQTRIVCLTVQLANLFVGGSLHADQYAAYLAQSGFPRNDQIINSLPASQIQIADAKIRSPGDLHRGTQRAKQVLVNVVEDASHCVNGVSVPVPRIVPSSTQHSKLARQRGSRKSPSCNSRYVLKRYQLHSCKRLSDGRYGLTVSFSSSGAAVCLMNSLAARMPNS